jgi:hypothetical protein
MTTASNNPAPAAVCGDPSNEKCKSRFEDIPVVEQHMGAYRCESSDAQGNIITDVAMSGPRICKRRKRLE